MDEWEKIQENYGRFLKVYENNKIIKDVKYPQRHLIKTGSATSFKNVGINDSDDYLIQNDDTLPYIPDLRVETHRKLPIELIRIQQATTAKDNEYYWKYTWESLCYLRQGETKILDDQTASQFEWTTFAFLFGDSTGVPNITGLDPKYDRIVNRSASIAAIVVFPLLERLLKYICRNDIGYDGYIKKGGKVRRLPNKGSKYWEYGDRCSRIADLLYHVEEELASNDFKRQLVRARRVISNFGDVSEDEVYGGIIGDWRNSLAHGSRQALARGEIIFNLICLFIWEIMEGDL